MWSALHLADGTHTHAVCVATHPDFGVGYVQHDLALTELTNVNSTEEVAENGLITSGIEMLRSTSTWSSSLWRSE